MSHDEDESAGDNSRKGLVQNYERETYIDEVEGPEYMEHQDPNQLLNDLINEIDEKPQVKKSKWNVPPISIPTDSNSIQM